MEKSSAKLLPELYDMTSYRRLELQWATKVLRHLALKSIFKRLGHIFPPYPQTMLIFLFLRLHRPHCLHNIELGAGGIRELMLDANKIEQVLKINIEMCHFLKVSQLLLSLIVAKHKVDLKLRTRLLPKLYGIRSNY